MSSLAGRALMRTSLLRRSINGRFESRWLVAGAHAQSPDTLNSRSPTRNLATAAASDKFVPRRRRSIDVQLPEYEDPPEEGPTIPYYPDSYDSKASESASPPTPPPSSGPKVLTVASASTHVAGGPSHNLFESSDAHVEEIRGSEADEDKSGIVTPHLADGGLVYDMKKDLEAIGIPTEFKVPPVKSSEAPDELDVPKPNPQLNEEQQKGLWVLLGLVVGGWTLGALARPKSPKNQRAH